MALTAVDFVDVDLSTVLFSLMSSTGSENSSYGSVITKFALGGSFKATAPHDAERFERPGSDGGFTTFSRRSLGQATWRQVISASSEANLRLGVGRLTDLVTRGGILKITAGVTRYLRFEPSPYPEMFAGKELELHDIYQQFAFRQGLDIALVCQPYFEGAEVTTATDTVEDDPATGTPDGSRVFALAVTGDLPTPGKVRAQMDTGAAVSKLLIASRARNTRASTYFSEYLSDTAWFQCEATNRNWTITLSNDTAATATDTTTASPATGSPVAQINGAGGTVGDMVRRVRATRTTALDSFRGSWRPFLRLRTTAAAVWDVQLRWGPATADPVAFSNPVVTHDTSAASAFGYVELDMGKLYIPETVALSGVAVEVWAKRTSGTGNLNLDLVWFPPDNLSAVVIAGGSEESLSGSGLTTAVSNPAGGTAGAPLGSFLVLDTTTDNAGWGPNAGTDLPDGRHTYTVELTPQPGAGGATILLRARNITDSLNTATKTVTLGSVGVVTTASLSFDAAAAKNYQFQLDDPSAVPIAVGGLTHTFTPTLVLNESVRTDPVRYAVDRLDSSGNLNGYLAVEGAVPVTLQPGDNHIMLRADEVALAGYEENENKLDRDLTVSVSYFPRYAL